MQPSLNVSELHSCLPLKIILKEHFFNLGHALIWFFFIYRNFRSSRPKDTCLVSTARKPLALYQSFQTADSYSYFIYFSDSVLICFCIHYSELLFALWWRLRRFVPWVMTCHQCIEPRLFRMSRWWHSPWSCHFLK